MSISGSNQPYYVKDLLMGYTWSGTTGVGANVTYSYDLLSWTYTLSSSYFTGTPALLNSAQRSAVDSAFASWANVANITFQNVGTSLGNNTNIVLRQVDLAGSASGIAYPMSPSTVQTSGDLIQKDDIMFDNVYIYNPTVGSRAYNTVMHEIGHALGLKHTHDYGLDGNLKMPAADDSYRATVMSYNNNTQGGSPISTTIPVGPMIYDIAAVQYLYGVNTTYHSGNDTYILNGTNSVDGINHVQNLTSSYVKVGEALWDAGGVDTLDSSSYSGNVTLDLREGLNYYSTVGQTEIWSAFGSNLENAKSGAGNDNLYGNNLNNLLQGGSGDDSYWFAGGSNFGVDTISDSVGSNKIYVNNTLLSGTALTTATAGLYQLIVGGVTYALTQMTSWLEIAATSAVNSIIKVLDFHTNDFGISLSTNHIPVAVADAVTISEDASHNINVLGNDSDVDGDTLTVSSVSTTSTIGLVSINPDKTINYNTNGKFDYLAVGETATDTFRYTTSDGQGSTATQTVTVTVTGANDAPTKLAISPAGGADLNNLGVGTEFRVNTNIANVQNYANVTKLSGGNLVVTWYDSIGVSAQILTTSGDKIGSEFLVSAGSFYPSILALENGNFVIISSTSNDSSNGGVSAQIFSPTGSAIGAEFQVNAYTNSYQYDPASTLLQNGNFIISWRSDGQDGSGSGIYAQLFSPSGVKIGVEFQVNTNTNGYQQHPAITTLHNGNFAITWDGASGGIFAQIFNASGTKVGTEVQVGSGYISSVAALDNGNFVTTFQQNDISVSGVFAQIVDSSGNKIGSEFQVNSHTYGNQLTPAIIALHNGLFLISWYDSDTQGDYGVYGQYFNADGTKMGAEFAINSTVSGDQGGFAYGVPGLSLLNNGDIIVTWYGNGSGDADGIYAKILKTPSTDLSVTENTAGAIIGDIKITDKDLHDTYTYILSDNRFEVVTDIDGAHLKLKDGISLDYEAANSVTLGVTATDAGGLAVTQQFTINIVDASDITIVNNAPTEISLSNNSINENVAGAAIGNLTAVDADAGDAHTYAVDDTRFEIINGNQLKLKSGISLDYEAASTVNLNITATDTGGLTVTKQLTINVGDVYENHVPVAVNDAAIVSEDSVNASINVLANDTDADGDTLTVSSVITAGTIGAVVIQPTIGSVSINANNTINYNTNGKFDYLSVGETATDTFRYTASDGQGGTATQTVIVTVNGANDAPTKLEIIPAGAADVSNLGAGTELQVNTIISTYQRNPETTALSNGNFVVTWMSTNSFFGIYAQIFNSSGVKVGNEFQVNTYTSGHSNEPVVTELSNGNFVIAWCGYAQGSIPFQICAQIFSVDGTRVGNEFLVNTDAQSWKDTPSIASFDNGNFVVTWKGSGQDGYGDVYAQIFNSSGTKIGNEFKINTYTVNDQITPEIATLSNGNFVVAWDSFGQDGSGDGVYAQIFNSSGTKIGNEFLVNTNTAYDQSSLAIEALNNGNFVITWVSNPDNAFYNYRVYAQIFNSSGMKIGNEFQVSTGADVNDLHSPAILELSSGLILIAHYGTDAQVHSAIYGQYFNEDGTKFGTEFIIKDGSFSWYQGIPKLAQLENDDIVVTWANGNSTSDNIYSKILKSPASDLSVTENAAGAVIGDVKVTDVDLHDTYTYTLTDNRFEVVTDTSGVHLKLKDGISLDYEAASSVTLGVTATDAGGLAVTQQFTINVKDAFDTTNHAPTAISLSNNNINENVAGAAIGNLTAVDADAGDAHTYAVDDTRFEIINGNQLKLKSGISLDYEEASTVNLNITATDTGGLAVTKQLTINVGDVYENHAPVAVSDSAIVSEDSVNASVNVLANDTDADGNTLTVSSVNATSTTGLVSINGDNTIKYNANGKFDYLAVGETAADTFQYTISDGHGGASTTTATVTINGENDAPTKIAVGTSEAADINNLGAGSEFRVNATTFLGQYTLSTTPLNNGNLVAVWVSDAKDGSGQGIYAQILTAVGAKIGGEVQINTYTSNDQRYQSTTALNDGNFVVTWQSDLQDNGTSGIYGQVLNSSGAKVGSEFQVNTYSTGPQHGAATTTLSNGNFVVTWESYAQDGSGYGIYAQIFNASGVKVGSEFQATTYTSSDQYEPSATALNNGNFVITWESYGQDSSGNGIYGQIFNASGTKVGSEFRANTYTSGSQQTSSITTLSSGNFVISWASNGQDGSDYGIYAQIFNSSGVKVGNELLVNTYTSGLQSSPYVLGLNNGMFLVSWKGAGANDDYGIYGQYFNANGTKFGEAFLINGTVTSYQHDPELSQLANGDIVVSWYGNGVGDSDGVFSKILKAPGNPLSVNEHVVGAVIGDVKVTDVDIHDTYTYTLTDNRFEVVTDQSGAHLKLKAGVSLNYDTASSIALNITATDSGGLSVTQALNIAVNDVANQAPIVANQIAAQSAKAGNAFSFVVPANAFTDADGDILTYRATLADGTDMPLWVNFNPTTRTFSGTAPWGDTANISLALIASDGTLTATQTFNLNIETNVINGTSVANTITGTAANEVIYGLAGDDTIYGKDGDDRIYGGAGRDKLFGGAGADYLDGGADGDSVSYTDSNAGVIINMGTGQTNGGYAQGDTLVSIDTIYGSNYRDIVIGTSDKDYLIGNGGSDTLVGNGGNDSLWGNDGDDFLAGGTGNDSLYGGNGKDQFIIYDNPNGITTINDFDATNEIIDISNLTSISNFNITVSGADTKITFGDNQLILLKNTVATLTSANFFGFGKINGTTGIDVLNGTPSNDIIHGDLGADTIKGNDGQDFIYGEGGDDTLYGNNANDFIYGGAGRDKLFGGAGADYLDGGADGDSASYTDSNAGINVNLATGVNHGGFAEGDTLASIDTIYGSNYADILTGSAAVDFLIGNSGNDVIFGAGGKDSLWGNDGSDVIHGGGGADAITGGAGVDYFVYDNITDSTATAFDTIKDFAVGQDKIDLTMLHTFGIESFADLTVTSNATTTFINANDTAINAHEGTPGAHTDFHLELQGVIALQQQDFVWGV